MHFSSVTRISSTVYAARLVGGCATRWIQRAQFALRDLFIKAPYYCWDPVRSWRTGCVGFGDMLGMLQGTDADSFSAGWIDLAISTHREGPAQGQLLCDLHRLVRLNQTESD